MRPHICAIRRREFVQDYLRALVTDGGFNLTTGNAICRSLLSRSPIELSKLGRALDNGLVMGVAPISLAHELASLGLNPDLFGRQAFGVQYVLADSDPDRIAWLRQVLSFAKKLPDPPLEDESVTLQEYAKRVHNSGRPKRVLDSDRELASRLLGQCPVADSLTGVKHGPGAVRDGERGREKWSWSQHFGEYQTNFYFNDLHELDHYPSRFFMSKMRQTCRAITVPKDFRRARVIAIESKELMFVGQGVKSLLYERLNRNSDLQIEFNDQARHRELLKDPEYASLDLSDASDMVSYSLVRKLLPRDWFKLCADLRSKIVFIDGQPVRARAMYTMGNPLCFPIEALVHYVAVRRVVPPHYRVSVYGDDLIVPRKYATWVMETLIEFGLKPSPSKSCFRTSFVESCGLDLFGGKDVTPAYLRLGTEGVSSPLDAIKLVSFQKHHWERGWQHAALMVSETILRFVSFPSTPYPHPWKMGGPDNTASRVRFSTGLQVLQYRVPELDEYKIYHLDGWNGLMAHHCVGTAEVAEKRIVPRLRYVWVSDTCHKPVGSDSTTSMQRKICAIAVSQSI